jgi:hypothetical protein
MDAVARRLKGTRFDPANAVQQPPVGTVLDESGKPKEPVKPGLCRQSGAGWAVGFR